MNLNEVIIPRCIVITGNFKSAKWKRVYKYLKEKDYKYICPGSTEANDMATTKLSRSLSGFNEVTLFMYAI